MKTCADDRLPDRPASTLVHPRSVVLCSVGPPRLVRGIGGVSIAESGLGYGELMDAPVVRERILGAIV